MQELSEALYGGYLRSEELLVLQLGNRCQRGHQDYMRDTNGKWQNDSATWFLCLAERRDLFLPGFANVTLTQGDVAVLFANTWHAGVAEQAGAHGSEVLFGYFDRATKINSLRIQKLLVGFWPWAFAPTRATIRLRCAHD